MIAQVQPQQDLHLNLPDPSRISEDIERDGLCIYPNAVAQGVIEELRRHWLDFFGTHKVDRKFVRGNIFLGERNFNSYSDINEWCMYRHFDFLWNDSDHPPTRHSP